MKILFKVVFMQMCYYKGYKYYKKCSHRQFGSLIICQIKQCLDMDDAFVLLSIQEETMSFMCVIVNVTSQFLLHNSCKQYGFDSTLYFENELLVLVEML